MDPDDDFGSKDDDIPWGKYTYTLEGLAKECYLEGAKRINLRSRPGAPPGKRLRFRIELPERCFILSIAIKLPNAPQIALQALEDVCIERTLRSAEYEMVHDGVLSTSRANISADNLNSPTGIVSTAQNSSKDNPRKKIIEMRRAADSLRITLADIDPPEDPDEKMRDVTDSESDMEGNKAGDFRILGVSVVGYVRGQTPVAGRIKILLNSSTRLGLNAAPADRAEIDGLLGLAFLGSKRYRQAAELLERASTLTQQVAIADSKKGFQGELGFSWAAELNLLAAHAYFEHEPRSNDGIARLCSVVSSGRPRASTSSLSMLADSRSGAMESLDVRTELLGITAPLIEKLVRFLGLSSSLAVQMASARMIEFVGEQLGCAVAPFIGQVLDQVLRDYPHVKPLGARDKAASASFSYDSMEDCYKKLVDISCRLLPLTEHSVLQRILEHILMPVLLEAFDEKKYIIDSENIEEECDELLCNAVSQTLRLIYLMLTILDGDAKVPPLFITKLLDMLILEKGCSRTPLVLRRSALHTWDATVNSVIQSAGRRSVKDFKDFITVQVPYVQNLIITVRRSAFEYENGDDDDLEYEFRSVNLKKSLGKNKGMQHVLERKKQRVVIIDRHTLNRLLSFMKRTFMVLEPCTEEDERHTATVAINRLLRVLNEAAADVFLSGLMDVSYNAAVVSGVGPDTNLSYFEYGSFSAQMKVSCETLIGLLDSYWTALRMLPSRAAEETEKQFLVRSVLTWCVEKMKYAAPPKGVLRMILCVVKGFQSESSCTFEQNYNINGEAKPLDLYRVNNIWLAQTLHEEVLDLHDILCPLVGKYMMAKDILDVIQSLGDQSDEFVERYLQSTTVLAQVIVDVVPADPALMKVSLGEIVDSKLDNPRIVDGFPKSGTASRGNVLTRKLRFASTQADHDPKTASLYVHTVLASCFDKFDGLSKLAKRKVGGLTLGSHIDAFIEHAAFLVKCLELCAIRRKHREYIDDTLGDILKTCLDMQDHGDGRVRLAGFEIFAAALDVLFLTEGSSTQSAEAFASGSVGVLANSNSGQNSAEGLVQELSPREYSPRSENINGTQSPSRSKECAVQSRDSLSKGEVVPTEESVSPENKKDDDSLSELYVLGGSRVFHASTSSASDLKFEEDGWLMLCNYMSTSLGMGKYADFVVHRACLEYIRGCILNALQGKSSGASVISFYHVESIWDAVLRLVGSPVHSLNGLALWVICATINVGIYSAVMAKGRGESKQRAAELEKFVSNKLFITAENFIKGGSKDMRLWGGRLLEVYIRARSMNTHSLEICPPPSKKVLMAIQALQNDWCEDARLLAKSLLDTHLEVPVNKPSTPSSSFTDRVSTFVRDRRFGGGPEQEEQEANVNHSKIELWFPALPLTSSSPKIERFGKTLEAFANAEIAGGEEAGIEYSDDEFQGSEYSRDDSIGYGEEEEPEYEPEETQPDSPSTSPTAQSDIDPEPIDSEQPKTTLESVNTRTDSDKPDVSMDPVDEAESKASENIEKVPPATQPEVLKSNLEPLEHDATDNDETSVFAKEPELRKDPEERTCNITIDSKGPKYKDLELEKLSTPNAATQDTKSALKNEKGSEDIEDDGLELDDIDEFSDFGVTIIAEPEEEEEDSSPKIELERRPSLPRVGSFTERKHHDVQAEGEVVRLEKRRSESSFTRKKSSEREDESEVSSSPGFRRSRIRDNPFLKSFDSEPLSDGGGSIGYFKSGHNPREVASAGFLPIPQRRVQRGVKLDDEMDEPGRDARTGTPQKGFDELRRQFENQSGRQSAPKSSSRRSLPRAPAFTKGVPPLRFAVSGSLPEKGIGSETFPAPSSGSSSSTSPPFGNRRLPRARSSSRMSKKIDDIGRRVDRVVEGSGEAGLSSRSAENSSGSKSASDRRRARRIPSEDLEKRAQPDNENNNSR